MAHLLVVLGLRSLGRLISSSLLNLTCPLSLSQTSYFENDQHLPEKVLFLLPKSIRFSDLQLTLEILSSE